MLTYQAPSSNFWASSLNGTINDSVDTITLNSTTGLAYPGVIIIDREDGNENPTPNSREVVAYTGISGNDITGCTRGAENSTARSHSSGALVEAVFSVGQWNDLIDSYQVGHDDAGTHKALTNQALTTPRITTSINDSGGNEVIKTPATASAVNEITVTNAATGNAPLISATGGDDNVSLKVQPKGTGVVQILDSGGNEILKGGAATASAVNEITVTNAATNTPPIIAPTGGDTNIDIKLSGKGTGKVLTTGHYTTVTAASPAGGATQDLNLALGNVFNITMPAGNITFTVSNESVGQTFIVSILQDGGGSRTVTWFSTIRWAGGTAPTLTTTASKRDTFGFIVTGTDTYDGFVIGRNA